MTAAHSIMGLAVCVIVCFGAAGIGSFLTMASIPTWYAALKKPGWVPPNWIFGPVWSALYAMMAVAMWLVWRQGGLATAALPAMIFGVQLALNVAWSAIFFRLHKPGAAFAEIIALWLAILATLILFWRSDVMAGLLMAPYLAWVSFAAVLNYTVWRLNP